IPHSDGKARWSQGEYQLGILATISARRASRRAGSSFVRATVAHHNIHGVATRAWVPTTSVWRIKMGQNGAFLSDVQELRKRAREHMNDGAVTPGYSADRDRVIEVL